MSRSDYSDDIDDRWQHIMWRGAVASAVNGARGQAFLREMLAALDALPEKKLIAEDLEKNGEVCAIGAVGRARGVDMGPLDPENSAKVAAVFGVSDALVRELAYENDEGGYDLETLEQRHARMRRWVVRHIR